MSDGSSSSNVVHSTLAANRLDPNIEADGHLNAGQGVGGTSPQTIKKEGVEHIKKQNNLGSTDSSSSYSQSQDPSLQQTSSSSFAPSYSSSSSGGANTSSSIAPSSQSAVHQDGIDYIKQKTFGSTGQPAASHASTSNALGAEPPTSNAGIDDRSGGIGQGAGGVSNSAYIDTPQTGEYDTTTTTTSASGGQQSQSVIGSTVEGIKSYLGFGGASSSTASDTSPGYGTTGGVTRADTDGPVSEYKNTPSSSSSTGIGSAATTLSSLNPFSSSTTNNNNSSSSTYNNTSSSYRNNPTTTGSMSDSSQSEQRLADPTADDVTPQSKGISSSERGLADSETTTGADKQTEATTDAGQAGAGPGDLGETNKPPAAAGGHTGSIENKSSIPTAGGERLGEKHWGESKIVPDVPKPQGESGVSSAAGQPTDQVRDNTAANTGGATGGPHSHAHSGADGEKEGLVDKIKDRLHMGKKE